MAKTVEEWLAEGNKIKEWGGPEDRPTRTQGGRTWTQQVGWPEWRDEETGIYGRILLGSTHKRILPLVCARPGCNEKGSVARAGDVWCSEHANDEVDE